MWIASLLACTSVIGASVFGRSICILVASCHVIIFAGLSLGVFFFFFQAEDGIRDYKVTGVQTCALPISLLDKAQLCEVFPGRKMELGPFEIEFIYVTHSTIDCVALAVRTPLGVIIHSGDRKSVV